MKILVTFALETEFAPWRSMHDFRRERWGGISDIYVYVAEIGGAQANVILTGAGPRQAGLRASEAIRREEGSINVCISTGLAGALKDTYQIGQVLVAKSVVSESRRADASSPALRSSEPLIDFAADCGATVAQRFYTSEHAVSRAEEKKHLSELADAVEMESFEVMREAASVGIPAIAVRSVSDLASEDLPLDMDGVFGDEGQVSIPRVLGQIALHPTAVPGLVKLGNRSKRASESLAAFLDRYVQTLASRMEPLMSSSVAASE